MVYPAERRASIACNRTAAEDRGGVRGKRIIVMTGAYQTLLGVFAPVLSIVKVTSDAC